MKTPARFALSRLSRRLYEDFFTKATARGLAFVRFQDFLPGAPPLPRRYIALHHDIDFAPPYNDSWSRALSETDSTHANCDFHPCRSADAARREVEDSDG